MIAWLGLAFAAGILLGVGPALAVASFRKQHWLLVGQRSGEAMRGVPLGVFAELNRTELPERRRSPDKKFVTRDPVYQHPSITR